MLTPADEFTDILYRLRSRDPDDPGLEDMLARLQQLHDAVRRENRAVREQLGRLLHDAAAKQDELNAELAGSETLIAALRSEVKAVRDAREAHKDLSQLRDEYAAMLLDAHRQSYTAVVDERREGR